MTTQTTYGIDDGHGNALTTGLTDDNVHEIAQRMADERGESVYVYEDSGSFASEAEEPEFARVRPRTVRCACGDWTHERCAWVGAREDTVVVEWMPEYLRGSHEAAGNRGSYPHNGAVRSRVERSCADLAIESEPEWFAIIG